MDLYCSLNNYDVQAFSVLIIQIFKVTPCLLCGEVHALSIHAYLWRQVHSAEEGSTIVICIIAIICRRAKKQGKQYTKRILPPFLIPYSIVSRESLVAYLRRFPDGTLHAEIAFQVVGLLDIRTIRRHLKDTVALIKKAGLRITRFLSTIPNLAEVPDRGGAESPVEYLDKAAQEMDRATARRWGGSAATIPSLVYMHAVDVYARARKPLVPPLSVVLRAVVFHDTS